MCTIFLCPIRNNVITIQTNILFYSRKAQMNCKALVSNRMHANGAPYCSIIVEQIEETMQLPSATCNIKMFRVASTTDLLKQHLS